MPSMAPEGARYSSLRVSRGPPGVTLLTLNRPARSNAINDEMFWELPQALRALDLDPDTRAVVLSGAGRNFCAGIDLAALTAITGGPAGPEADGSSGPGSERRGSRPGDGPAPPAAAVAPCEGRQRVSLLARIEIMQDAVSAIERCRKPVIAAVHGACVGGGVDIITACDIRYCASGALFSVKEVDLAITADLGTLQRLPGIIGQGAARELALTGRQVSAEEARSLGLVSAVFPTADALTAGAAAAAAAIAAKSPLAVVGTKAALNYGRDHAVGEGLHQVALWNSATLVSEDLREVARAQAARRPPHFSNL